MDICNENNVGDTYETLAENCTELFLFVIYILCCVPIYLYTGQINPLINELLNKK